MAKDGAEWHVYFKPAETIETGEEVVVTVEQLQFVFRVKYIGTSVAPEFTLIYFESGHEKTVEKGQQIMLARRG